ncbi:MAG: Calx-beta domain-containing protein [Steroidobacteraceae bacterium]
MSPKFFAAVGALAVFMVLSACGGGGGNSASNSPPTPQPGSLQFAGAVSVDEQAGTVQLSITRTAGSDGAVSVTVASSDGTATAGQDYTALNTTVNFAAGDTAAKNVTLTIAEDAQGEADETFVVSLTAPTGGAQLGAVSTAIVTIRDNEPAPAAPTVAVSAALKELTFTWASVPGATSYRLLQNADGASGFTQVGADYPGDAVTASVEVSVHQQDWVNGLYRIEACSARGCTGSNSVGVLDAMLQAIGYFKASNTNLFLGFGFSVALSGDGATLAVGAILEASDATGINGDQNNNGAGNSGAVYVFARDGMRWAQQAYVKASNTNEIDLFGSTVALSADGSTLAVGAPAEDSAATGVNGNQASNAADTAGAVYVFTRAGTQWSQQAYVKASNTAASDRFGQAISLSGDGDTLAVGAADEDSAAIGINGNEASNAAGSSGAVYVFKREAAQWAQQAYVKASNTESDDSFGASVALNGDGNTLAVGALGEESQATGVGGNEADNAAPLSGAVYVFTRAGAQWSQQAYVKASNTDSDDKFGSVLALSADGHTLAVSAVSEQSSAVGVDADQSNNDLFEAGAVYVFTLTGAQWSQQAYVKASNTGAEDHFGAALGLSADGNTLAVGAPLEDSDAAGVGNDQQNDNFGNAGAVYVFTRAGTQWSQRTYVKAATTTVEDGFGAALGLSADGSTLAVGAQFDDGGATGVGTDQDNKDVEDSGAVYVF